MEKKVSEAKELLQEARAKYDAAKEANDKQDLAIMDDVEEVSDGMEEEGNDTIKATSEKIQAGIASMISGMETFRERPNEEAAEAHQAKKPRLEPGEPGGNSGFGSAALKPFAVPGK